MFFVFLVRSLGEGSQKVGWNRKSSAPPTLVPEVPTGLPVVDPFLWQNGNMKDLGNLGGTNDFLGPFVAGLNNRGEVTGTMALAGDQIIHAFLWVDQKLSDLNASGGIG